MGKILSLMALSLTIFNSKLSYADWRPVMENAVHDLGCGISKEIFPGKKICVAMMRVNNGEEDFLSEGDRGWDLNNRMIHIKNEERTSDKYFVLMERSRIDSFVYYTTTIVSTDEKGTTKAEYVKIGMQHSDFFNRKMEIQLKDESHFGLRVGDKAEEILNLTVD